MVLEYLIDSYGDMMFDNLNMSLLTADQAYFQIVNLRNDEIFLYDAFKECTTCSHIIRNGYIKQNLTLKIYTRYDRSYKVLSKYVPKLSPNSNSNVICDVDEVFKEFGVYRLTVGENNCTMDILKEPANIYMPILAVFLTHVLIFVTVIMTKFALRKLCSVIKTTAVEKTEVADALTKFEDTRLRSLDTFRGIIIVLMIFVNYGGNTYRWLAHTVWYGVYLADLLFPGLLWIMGFCIPLTMTTRIKKGHTLKQCMRSNFKISSILLLLGICLSRNTALPTIRITGELQRLGICYLFHSSVCFMTMQRPRYYSSHILTDKFADIARAELSWLLVFMIMIVHTIVVFFVPFEECPSGYFGPGGYHEDSKYFNCTGGITGYIDRTILGGHMLQNGDARIHYSSLKYDPEGLLGTLPSLALCCFGVQAGYILLTFKDSKSRTKRWFVWGVLTGLIGGSLCGFSWSGGIIPLCRPIWTASFMLVACSFAFITFTLCFIIVDVQKVWDGKPFVYPGVNSLAVYLGHHYTWHQFPFYYNMDGYSTHFMRLLPNTSGTVLWVWLAYCMYKKKIFIKN